MALKKPLVLNNGQIEQLQSSDSLDAYAIEVDQITMENTNASAITIGQPVYVAAADQVDLARANAAGTSDILGLVKDASIANSATGSIQTDGILFSTDWTAVVGSATLTAGSIYFLSSATAGQLSTTAPTTPGDFVVRIGKAISTTDMEITLEPPIKL